MEAECQQDRLDLSGLNSTRRDKHLEELKSLASSLNLGRPPDKPAVSLSDIVNACLDFLFEHPLGLICISDKEELRDAIARAVYRKAFFNYALFYEKP